MTRLVLLLSVFLAAISSGSSFAPSGGRTLATTSLQAAATTGSDAAVDMGNVGFVLLAGGKGSRMKASMPKQFLELQGKPVLQHSLDLFLDTLPAFLESNGKTPSSCVVVVMDPSYQPEYSYLLDKYPGKLAFANPGAERQGSVENGLNRLVELAKEQGKDEGVEFAAIHDSARPLVTIDEICHVVSDAQEVGAAVLGVPCKATIKESEDGSTVLRTIPRARLWEVHTPQVVNIDTLLRGFAKVEAENLEVTDDVSIVEALGEPVKLTLGEYTNLKITTPEDMDVATAILEERTERQVA